MGQVLLTLGKPGTKGNPPEALTEPTDAEQQRLWEQQQQQYLAQLKSGEVNRAP